MREQVRDLKAERAKLRRTVVDLRFERDALRSENTQLREGLPAAIKAVPIGDFFRLVFTPAREAWRCDSFYTSPGYWSLDFSSGC